MRLLAVFASLLLAGCATTIDLTKLNRPDVHNCVSGYERNGTVWLTQSSADFSTTHVLRGAERASFSSGTESGSALSPDGQAMVLTSRQATESIPDRWNLWQVQRDGNGWSSPAPLPAPVNGPHAECCGTFGPSGELYFSSTRNGSWDIFVARDASIERLGSAINAGSEGPPDESGRDGDWPSYVDPRGRFLLFSSIRKGGVGGDDIYISRRSGNQWTPAVNLGPRVNTEGYEDCASVTPDGKYLVWSSRGREKGAMSQIRMMPMGDLHSSAPK